jgi:membrane-associated phospholipid phosphatase
MKVLCLLLLLPTLAHAQAKTVADVASWATVATVEALDVKASWESPGRGAALTRQAVRVGAAYGAVYLAKALVKRQRPCAPDCGIDNPAYSFFSAHTTLAFSTFGGPRLSVMLPLAIGTGGLRVAAGKHHLSDVLVGAGVGILMSRLR